MDDDVQSLKPEPRFWDREFCCKRRGCMLCLRFFRCPCGRTSSHIRKQKQEGNYLLEVPTDATLVSETRNDNIVITSKYTPWDFLPAATLLQFRRAVNVYFLFQVILLMVGNFAPNLFGVAYTPWGTLAVLTFVIFVTLVTEFYDDYQRHQADRKENEREVLTIDSDSGLVRKTLWKNLLPGDLVVLKNRDLVPADILILETSSDNGNLYIETSGIDGETNLKIKLVPKDLSDYLKGLPLINEGTSKETKWPSFAGIFEYDRPSPLLSFSGKFTTKQDPNRVIPFGFESLVLRGSEIRNTKRVIGLCMYCGVETKLVLSKRKTPSKFATLDYLINRFIFFTILQSFVLTIVAVVCLFVIPSNNTDMLPYMQFSSNLNAYTLPGWLAYTFTFLNFFSNVVPIDLYVCVEIANVFQNYFLCHDKEMIHNGVAAQAKTTNLISEIGQVSHIFSDKTGTLTENVMRLVGLGLPNGQGRLGLKVPDAVYHSADEQAMPNEEVVVDALDLNDTRAVFSDFLQLVQNGLNSSDERSKLAINLALAMILCHTIIVDIDEKTGERRYNAEGPDEEALVKGCANLGFILISTDNSRYVVKVLGQEMVFKVLIVFPFNHIRKRMSILLRKMIKKDENTEVDGPVYLYTKGADNVIMERSIRTGSDRVTQDLDSFAQNGLRTLLFAKKDISENELKPLLEKYQEVKVLLGPKRSEEIANLAERIETNMQIIGSSAIEDALQKEVPETIKLIRSAGIKIWVLTGDKVDTAVNIGFSCKLLDVNMHQIYLTETEGVREKMRDCLEILTKAVGVKRTSTMTTISNNKNADSPEQQGQPDWTAQNLALIVTGKTLEGILSREGGSKESEEEFITLARLCEVVLACRVSPSQKALLVKACSEGEQGLKTNPMLAPFRRKRRAPVTLAIGDGANDVPMIQQAKVGVGISGKEGLQAVNSADFAIAQFRFLQRLLFVHGRWSYGRNTLLFQFICYSWQVLNWCLFFYLFQSLVSGEQVFVVTYYITLFAWLCNFLITVSACFNRDISPKIALAYPKSYDLGRLNQMLKMKTIFFHIFLRSLVHALLIYYLVILTFPLSMDLNVLGSSMYMSLFTIMTLMQVRFNTDWSWPAILCLLIIIAGYWVTISIIDVYFSEAGVALIFTYDWTSAYEAMFLVLGAVLALEYAFSYRRLFHPTFANLLVERDRGYGLQDLELEAEREGVDRVNAIPTDSIRNLFETNEQDSKGEGSRKSLSIRGRPGFVDFAPDMPNVGSKVDSAKTGISLI